MCKMLPPKNYSNQLKGYNVERFIVLMKIQRKNKRSMSNPPIERMYNCFLLPINLCVYVLCEKLFSLVLNTK